MQIERGGRSVLRSGGKLSSLMPLIQLAGPARPRPAPPNARTHPSFFTEVKPGRSCSYPHPHSRADGSSGVDVKQTTRSSSVITAPLARDPSWSAQTELGSLKIWNKQRTPKKRRFFPRSSVLVASCLSLESSRMCSLSLSLPFRKPHHQQRMMT